MWKIILTIILTSAFFILFFDKGSFSKNKRQRDVVKVSTADGFIEDTRDAFIIPVYPTQVMDRDITGEDCANLWRHRYIHWILKRT